MAVKPAVLLASAAFVGALGYGGISLASAQTSTTTPNSTTAPNGTTTPDNSTAPNTTAPNNSGRPHDRANCPNGGSSGSTGSTGSNGSNGTGYLQVPGDATNSV
jgi:hypothetical protein